MKLALVCRLWSEYLGIVYVLTDKNRNIHVINSPDTMLRLRNNIVNYEIEKSKVAIKQPGTTVYSKLIFKTTDYFDLRDITVRMYESRVYTLSMMPNMTKRKVINYEVNRWLSEEVNVYRHSQKWIDEAIEYLNSSSSNM